MAAMGLMLMLVILLSLVKLRVVKAVRFKHDNLVIALIILILGMIRDATLRSDLTRAI